MNSSRMVASARCILTSRAGALLVLTSLAGALAVGVVVTAQQARITNGRVTTQPAGTPFAQTFRALVSSQTDVAWLGYTVPVVDSERIMCCFSGDTVWVNDTVVSADGSGCCRACRLEPAADGTSMANRAPASTGVGIVRLQGSDRMVVLFRIADRTVDRIRVFSEDCALDAGGRSVTWLDGVRPADSVSLLESFAGTADGRSNRIADGAISAIALHGDPAADAVLERLVATSQPEAVRKKVTFWLGNTRGARGLATLRRVLEDDPSADVQKSAVFGVSQSREANAFEVLLGLARSDPNPRIRGEAVFWLAQKAGQKAAAAITERVEQDPDTEVKKRAVFALSQMPKDEGVPLLINVARTHANPAVRKQAMFWLGQSKDPRAVEFFAEILK
jgi:HEAT repeat protein